MTTLVENPTVVDDAVARLTDMFRNKPVVRALTETIAERFAAEELVDLDVYVSQWIDAASGDLLDAAGAIVGEPRLGRADDLYRLWIKARVRINRTNGQIRDSYHLVRLIAGEGVTVHYTPTPPAAYIISVDDTDVDAHELFKLLDAVRPAGVRMNLDYDPGNDTTTQFTYAPTGTIVHGDNDKGYGDSSNPTTGGRYRGVL